MARPELGGSPGQECQQSLAAEWNSLAYALVVVLVQPALAPGSFQALWSFVSVCSLSRSSRVDRAGRGERL